MTLADAPTLDAVGRRKLIERRVGTVRALVQSRGGKEAVLTTRRNVSWLTVGAAAHVEATTEEAVAHVRVTPTTWTLGTTVIEERRLREEELADLDLPIEKRGWEADWSPPREASVLRDADLERQLRVLRAALVPAEHDRMRWLGWKAEQALRATADGAKPGDTETLLAAALAGHLARDTIRAPVVLVAADERIARYRHPLPTTRRVARTLMLVVCAERWGLHVALTRMVAFAAPPPDVALRYAAARDIEQAMHSATGPGRSLAEVLAEAIAGYRRAGHAEEWRLHHQGGIIGYRTREVIATPTTVVPITAGMAFAWNPSITGAKVEDTFVLLEDGSREVVTRTGAWPRDSVGAPAILER